MSLKAKDYLSLPERIENVIRVEMSPKEWELYIQMLLAHPAPIVIAKMKIGKRYSAGEKWTLVAPAR